ncbi:hypothetical protein G6F46_009318 [Rhizopus delemar]|uniref:non-specific serine/threonine protein kinase n=2 Tax=Rhizopus TaxID=4842 RepID=A0A9P6YU88_9FUNG|nr:hypothetical protein G6F55_010395 [Rhizopus delemar]KAG1536124.1 hypothetical protein G6F51_011144 [Rhizopus arrhizus]KAG1490617.1 hypothetical protein G6F54_010596 [Rhizopus delemar]KAG1507215.1 hypothetical protein G6F53_009117 [Rhizopus delemar]KAG1519502.1 hypothetical protein G6F52_008561 [Rhizopus delemar]
MSLTSPPPIYQPNQLFGTKLKLNNNQLIIQTNSTKQSNSYTLKKKDIQVGPNDFEKVRLLGKGDAGKVYLVRHKSTEKLYALKVLSKKEMKERNKVKRALTEQAILSTANHPFIVPLYHSFQSQNYLYFCLEFCVGGEFFRALRHRPGGILKENEAKFYAAEVVAALEYLHLMGIVFRDLKPENILLHQSGHLMLSDFDLSLQSSFVTQPTFVQPSFTFLKQPMINTRIHIKANSFVGTEEYLAPEIIRGEGHSCTVDWWTLGIFIYEMLCGYTPFKGKTRKDTFELILNEPIEFQPYFPQTLTNHAKRLIRQLLNKDPNKRLGSQVGASEVKSHPFFTTINFALLRHMKPPIIPSKAQPIRAVHFNRLKESVSFELKDSNPTIHHDQADPFASFSSVTIER